MARTTGGGASSHSLQGRERDVQDRRGLPFAQTGEEPELNHAAGAWIETLQPRECLIDGHQIFLPFADGQIDMGDFQGTGRFTVRRRLGEGGMGIVYEVDDTVRHEVVALKTLRHATAADVYRLTREFRSLADVVHPNLICLYELFADDHRCFFTMELVRGCNFVEYVRGDDDRWRSEERLVSAFGQLVNGVLALHRVGKLHRDLKPSNVLVTPEARVVILDFGLITEVAPRAIHDYIARRQVLFLSRSQTHVAPTHRCQRHDPAGLADPE
jgi:serine/threonine protein kinase